MILINTIIQEDATPLAREQGQAEILSIYQVMEHLSDTRQSQGKRYPLALVLTYILLAKAAGETTLLAISEWITAARSVVARSIAASRTTLSVCRNVQQRLTHHRC